MLTFKTAEILFSGLSSLQKSFGNQEVAKSHLNAVKTVHAYPLTAECKGLETTYQDLHQLFQHSCGIFD